MFSRTRLGVSGDVEAGDLRPPAARPQQAAQDPDRGRFARPVGTEEPHDLAAPRLEAHLVDRHEVAEALGEPVGDDLDLAGRAAAHSPPSPVSSATNRSSIDGAIRSICVVSDAGLVERGGDLSRPAGRVVDHHMHAVAHQDRAFDAVQPGRRRARPARLAR